METKTLSTSATKVIQDYFNIPALHIACPYYHGGKSTPEELADLAKEAAHKNKVSLDAMNNDIKYKFSKTHKIGIDCSGLAFNILEKETKGPILNNYPYVNIFRKIGINLFSRQRENTDVASIVHDSNSREISIRDIKPGDIIYMLNMKSGGVDKIEKNHLLIITTINYENSTTINLHYVHSGLKEGVVDGHIDISSKSDSLLDQTWSDHLVLDRYKRANKHGIRRLHNMDK